MNIRELVSELSKSKASLWYGAGITIPCGGPTWTEYFNGIKNRFPGGTSKNPFKYFEEIIGYKNEKRGEIENYIRNILSSISCDNDVKYLFSLPWKAVMTTNYDLLPDSIDLSIDENRRIIPISDITNIKQNDNILYCFKLMGDINYKFKNGGWMILTETDFTLAASRMEYFFNLFKNLATSGIIVYIGYSFDDDLVFKLLYHMKMLNNQFPWKGYANPSSSFLYLFK